MKRNLSYKRSLVVFVAMFLSATLTGAEESVTGNVEQLAGTESQLKPRDEYNRAIAVMKASPDDAEPLLLQARQNAGSDGELRFRATYNLGCVSVSRADALLESEPREALEQLQEAAGWFRETVRLRNDFPDARHNLEVVLKRIVQLRDQLNQSEPADLAGQLDAAIARQRSTVAGVRQLVEELSGVDDPNLADKFRDTFRRLAVDQRTSLSDLQDVLQGVANELESIDVSESQQDPQQLVRAFELTHVLEHLNQASQRIGQSRNQLRRRQAMRAFRRAAAGLNELKRAREQLRTPLEVLDGILADAGSTARQTAMKVMESSLIGGDSEITLPEWIDAEYLADSQRDLTQRTAELTQRMEAGLRQSAETESQDTASAPNDAQQQTEFLELLRDALPHLQQGDQAMEQALGLIETDDFQGASDAQHRAIEALNAARERFADIRALIELIFQTQSQIDQLLTGLDELEQTLVPAAIEASTENQAKNLERIQRLEKKIGDRVAERLRQQQAQDDSVSEPSSATTAGTPADEELQRFELAAELTAQAIDRMKRLADTLSAEAFPDDDAEWETRSSETLESIVALRRLFFSVVEHLKETAQRQMTLNDETETLAGLQNSAEASADANAASSKSVGPLADTQRELSGIAGQIATVLQQQADQPAPANAGEMSAEQQQMLQENAEKSRQASGLVSEAQEAMDQVVSGFGESGVNVAAVREPQDTALEKLIQAIQVLQPPQQNPDPGQGDSQPPDQPNEDPQNQQSESPQSGQSPSEADAEEDPADQAMDPSRILQAVRDREAQRRRQQKDAIRSGQIPVARDW